MYNNATRGPKRPFKRKPYLLVLTGKWRPSKRPLGKGPHSIPKRSLRQGKGTETGEGRLGRRGRRGRCRRRRQHSATGATGNGEREGNEATGGGERGGHARRVLQRAVNYLCILVPLGRIACLALFLQAMQYGDSAIPSIPMVARHDTCKICANVSVLSWKFR